MCPPGKTRREVRDWSLAFLFLAFFDWASNPFPFLVLAEKNKGLGVELEEAKAKFAQKAEEHDRLRIAVDTLREYLGVPAPTSAVELVQGVEGMPQRVHAMGVASLHYGVLQTLAIARSHYENINLDALSRGFPAEYTDEELDGFEREAAPFAAALSEGMKGDDDFPCKPPKP